MYGRGRLRERGGPGEYTGRPGNNGRPDRDGGEFINGGGWIGEEEAEERERAYEIGRRGYRG